MVGVAVEGVLAVTPPNLPPTTPGDPSFMRGRLDKAKNFLESAETLLTVGSTDGVLNPSSPYAISFVDLCVDAGIAAADAICVKTIGRYNSGAHNDGVAVLQSATDRSTAKHLDALVRVKTRAAYSARPVDAADIHNAGEAARALVAAAQDLI